MADETPQWYGVRCIIRFPDNGLGEVEPDVYEERVTIWRAASFDHAIEKAETEVADYVDGLEGEYLGVAQAYRIDGAPDEGAEVFSLTRGSKLEPTDYLNRYFDDGSENQQHTDDPEPRSTN